MSREPYHIPAWEVPMLADIVSGRYPAAREDALRRYVAERERRRRHAQVRDERDTERRTLVGAHVPRERAYLVARIAEAEGLSVTAFVKLALDQAIERSDSFRHPA